MTARAFSSERERVTASLDRCEDDLRQARERARRAGEVLRRALRGVEEAEGEFRLASRRLEAVSRSPAITLGTRIPPRRPADHHPAGGERP